MQVREGRTRPQDAGGASAFDPETVCRLSNRSGLQQPLADTVHQLAIRIVLHLFAFSGSGRRTSNAATGMGLLRHDTVRRTTAPSSVDSVHCVAIDSSEAAVDNSCRPTVQIERHAPDWLNKNAKCRGC